MTKTAYLFSGQGAQYEGMGKDLVAGVPEIADFYAKASTILEYDPTELTAEQLQDTRFSQPATVCHSLAIWSQLAKARDAVLGGFSLGEYSAFAASGLLDPFSLLRLVRRRAQLMSDAGRNHPGAMYAILGLEDQVIEELLAEEFSGSVWAVNYNCPGQLVIAGHAESTEAAAERLKTLGARRALPLQVSGAFHTPLMTEAGEALATYAADLSLNAPNHTLYSNNTALPLLPAELDDFPAYLLRHMTRPVYWTRTIQNMYRAGVRNFVELGPGKTLRGLVQKTLKDKDDVRISNIDTLADLEASLAEPDSE